MSERGEIALDDIEEIKNYREVEPVSEKDPDVIELAASIRKAGGILQPALCRPHPDPVKNKAGKVQLICGHRRKVAAHLAGLATMPCFLKNVQDEDILETQVTENLQRKDVHPMDEAVAFRSLIKDKNYMTDDIAAKFGKKAEFILQRLKLCDLVPDVQKRFKKGELTAAQAFLVCRLKPEDQKTLNKEWSAEDFASASAADVTDWINRSITLRLNDATFDKEDVTLVPPAGPCSKCPKRSGCGNLLFADLKDDDRCFDKACFELKTELSFMRKVTDTIETKPNIKLIAGRGDVSKSITKLAADHHVKIIPSSDYQTFSFGDYRLKETGLYLSGFSRGQTDTIYLKGGSKFSKGNTTNGGKPIKRTAADVDAEIKGIQTRQKRALELDLNKTHIEVREALAKKQEIKKPGLKHQGTFDRAIMIFLLLDKAMGSSAERIVEKALKNFPDDSDRDKTTYQVDYFKKLAALSDDDLAYICRQIIIDHWGKSNLQYGVGFGDTAIYLIAQYAGIDIAGISKAQNEEAAKRIARTDKRIEALKKEKKELASAKPAVAVPTKKAVPKPTPKKSAKAAKKSGGGKTG